MGVTKSTYRYIIVGAGIAGVTAARSIRQHDESGSVLLLSSEDRVPYKRTKISKNIAKGFSRDAFELEEAAWYSESRVDLLYGETAESIDPKEHTIRLQSGEKVAWEKLILATGAAPILPPELQALKGGAVHVVRTAAEVEELERAVVPAGRVFVVGNGVLGVEVVEQLRLLGKEVTLVGHGPRVLARHLNEELSQRLERLLVDSGVRIIANEWVRWVNPARTAADRADAHRGGSLTVQTSKGSLDGDMVVFCAGVRPRVGLARDAGLSVAGGVLVDEELVTSHPDIYAAGDVAEHPGGYVSFLWHAAELQGEIAGANASGERIRHDSPPFRLKCEVFGDYYFAMNRPSSEEGHLARVDRNGRRYRCLYYREGALIGAVMVNDKERAKSYVRAVREGWDENRVAAELPL